MRRFSTIRTARLASRCSTTLDGEKAYILAPDGLAVGDTVVSSRNADIKPGNSLPLRFIPVGTMVHNLELKIGKGAQLVRSAGAAAQLMAKDGDYAQVRLPSGEVRLVHLNCRATVGQVSQPGPLQGLARQGRSLALARSSPAQPRRHHEPGRPSHGWW